MGLKKRYRGGLAVCVIALIAGVVGAYPAHADSYEPGQIYMLGYQSQTSYAQYDTKIRLGDNSIKFTSTGYTIPKTTTGVGEYFLATDSNNNLYSYPMSNGYPAAGGKWTQCASGYKKATSGGAITTDGAYVMNVCSVGTSPDPMTTTTGETIHINDISYVDDNQSNQIAFFASTTDGRLFGKWKGLRGAAGQWEQIPLPADVDGVRSVNFSAYQRTSDDVPAVENTFYSALSLDGTKWIRGMFVPSAKNCTVSAHNCSPQPGTVIQLDTPTAYLRTASQLGTELGNDISIDTNGNASFMTQIGGRSIPVQPLRQFEGYSEGHSLFNAIVLTGTPGDAPSDATPPTITTSGDQTIHVGDQFDPMNGATATDNEDGDLTSKITVNGTVDNQTPGAYTLTYSVTDSAGNTATASRTITVIQTGTTIACAPQTGDPASSVWQATSLLGATMCIGLAGIILVLKRKTVRRI